MKDLLGPGNFPYFSVAIGQILTIRYLQVYLICSLVALFHLAGEWLYLGKYPHRLWLGLILCLVLIGVGQSYWLQPRLRSWHRLRYAGQRQHQAVERAFDYARATSQILDLLAIAGIAVYLWRVAHPLDPARFLSASKFRS